MGNCQHPGCASPATEVHDRSIQLPDYLNLCAPHAVEYRRKQSSRFYLQVLHNAVAGLEKDTAREIAQMKSYLAKLEELLP